jgi:hypothetical protein
MTPQFRSIQTLHVSALHPTIAILLAMTHSLPAVAWRWRQFVKK